MSENTPKAVTNDPELATGDFSDTSSQPLAPQSLTTDTAEPTSNEVSAEPNPEEIRRPEEANSSASEQGLDAASEQVAPERAAGLASNHPEHLEPFWVPLKFRKAQKRDTIAFGLSAIVAIIAGAGALAYFNPFGGELTGPSWLGPTAAGLAIAGVAGVLIFGIFALVDLSKSERAYYTSTHDWLSDRYGLDLSKHKVKVLSKHRNSVGGVTGWKKVNLEGYPQGVQITYTERYGYRLITTVDNVESQLPRSAR